jgi:hypothetical protein
VFGSEKFEPLVGELQLATLLQVMMMITLRGWGGGGEGSRSAWVREEGVKGDGVRGVCA